MIVVIGLALLAVIIARAFRRPVAAKVAAKRQRMPSLVLIGGSGVLAIGFVLTLGSFMSPLTADLLPMRIAGATLFSTGIGVLVAYRNWYLETGTDAVRYRTVFGREKQFAYRDITACRRVGTGRQQRLVVRAKTGEKLTVNLARYDASRLLAAAPVSP